LPTPLLHLGLSLACLGLWHTRCILVSTSHTRIHAPGGVDAVSRNYGPQKPGVVSKQGGHDNAGICPVDDVPHVLGQTLGIEIFTGLLDGAVSGEGGTGEALQVELDEQLRSGEEQVEDERFAGEGGPEEEGTQEPPDGVDSKAGVERLVEAFCIRRSERLGGFLTEGISNCGVQNRVELQGKEEEKKRLTCAIAMNCWREGATTRVCVCPGQRVGDGGCKSSRGAAAAAGGL